MKSPMKQRQMFPATAEGTKVKSRVRSHPHMLLWSVMELYIDINNGNHPFLC